MGYTGDTFSFIVVLVQLVTKFKSVLIPEDVIAEEQLMAKDLNSDAGRVNFISPSLSNCKTIKVLTVGWIE